MENQEWKPYKHFGKSGRPPDYDDRDLDILAQSLNDWVNYLAANEEFGLLGDWCFKNEFNPKYFSRYTPKHEKFREAYQRAKSYQEHAVTKGALTQKLNPRFAQFFLGCQHHWRTKDAQEDKLGQLRNEFGKYLDIIKSEAKHIEEEAEDSGSNE